MASATTTVKGNEARTAAGQAFDKVRDTASQGVEKAKEAAGTVGEMVSNAASTVGRKADDFTSSAGTSIKNFGDTLREHTPKEGMLGEASKTVANTTKQVGRYLEEEGLSGMFEDMTNLIRRNPVPAILVGVGLGVLIGRLLRS